MLITPLHPWHSLPAHWNFQFQETYNLWNSFEDAFVNNAYLSTVHQMILSFWVGMTNMNSQNWAPAGLEGGSPFYS